MPIHQMPTQAGRSLIYSLTSPFTEKVVHERGSFCPHKMRMDMSTTAALCSYTGELNRDMYVTQSGEMTDVASNSNCTVQAKSDSISLSLPHACLVSNYLINLKKKETEI